MRFGRRSGSKDEVDDLDDGPGSVPEPVPGPYDITQVDADERECIDLGSLLVTPDGDMELRLQVDEESGQVIAAVLLTEEGALELRAFAASRGPGAWDELRPRIAAETERLGGTATEQDGSFGTELLCVVPMENPEGQTEHQPSRIIGYEGSAWLLRATLMGRPAVEPDAAGPWEQTIRQTVVRRGRDAMAPGAPLPLTLPPEARRIE